MLRAVSQRLGATLRGAVLNRTQAAQPAVVRMMSHGVVETDEEFDARYVAYLSRPNIDGWEIRRAMHELVTQDLVPEPKVIIAALQACRRVNDYSLTTRFLEAVRFRCEVNSALWPYVVKEIQPTLTELGISTPDELGYDKPEFALKSVFDA